MEKRFLSVVFLVACPTIVVFSGNQAYADTPPSSNASILFQQLDTSGTPVNILVQGGNGAGHYAQFVGQRQGSMAPYLRLRMKMANNFATSGPLINFDAADKIPVTLDVYNLSGACHMMRTEYFPASWANDGLYHDFDWSPGSPQYQPYLVVCAISPGVSYNIGVITSYANVDLLAAADSSGVPYMINSVDPLDQTFPPAGPVPPASPTTGLIWQSAPSHSDEVSLYSNYTSPPAFNGTRYSPVIPLGTWTGADFTTDASTTVHVWDRSGDPINWTILDVGLAASSGGNPYYAQPASSTHLIYGYPYNNHWIAAIAPAATTTQELILPTNLHSVIHHGDEMWGFLYPSYAASFYFGGTDVFMGGMGNIPQYQICQGSCESTPPPPPACTQDCFSNVLFLPGIESSRLYRPQVVGAPDRKLWEPGFHDDLHELHLTPQGASVHTDIYTKQGDVIDETPIGTNIYKSFIAKMDDLKTQGIINDWEAAPYDWRLSLDDILAKGKQTGSNISYLQATDTPYIIQELRRLAASSKSGKVTIIAHSNGGLVAKRLTEVLGAAASTLIDKMIFVAVPQVGTPVAILDGLHGEPIAYGLAASKAAVRTFASTSPMMYHLLPSANYFTYVDDPVMTFDPSLTDWTSRYGSVIHSSELLHQFLIDTYGRVDAETGDTNQPIQLSDTLLTSAEALHEHLDNWTPPAGVELIQIAGWGVPKTVVGLSYKKKGTGIVPESKFTIDGDGTVVVPSALWVSTTASTTNYWLDLNDYNRDHPFQSGFGFSPFDHSRILEIAQLLTFLSDQITNVTNPLADYAYLSIEAPPSNDVRLRYALHSPLTLNLYDSLGHHTGVSTTTGQVEEQIPGTYYTEFGDTKYIFSDASSTAHVVMKGYASGTFTFNVDELQGDTLVASTTFQDIPTTPDTVVTLDTTSGVVALSPMRIDTNGDGATDATLAPKLNDVVSLDTTPPEIQITFSTSTNALAFTGTDDQGLPTITSTTTYPALKKNQKEYKGIATTTVTARDVAGNTTVLVYTEQLPSPAQRDTITLLELAYNGATSTVASATISYKWRNKKDDSYKLFASHIRTASSTIESHYRPKKNITVVMTKPQDMDDSDDDDDSDLRPTKLTLPGMMVSYVTTDKSAVVINY